jgi:8-oxo-dGTP pyrophosphatase MutT (NUDIX family)
MGKEISRRTLASGQILSLESIRWRDVQGNEAEWEVAVRRSARPAALIIAWLHPSDRLVLVRQYRPPAAGDVIEFPAGLIDAGETPEAAALRELLEETGYHGRVLRMLPCGYNTPGLSSDRTHVALVEVDEAHPLNTQITPRHETGEEIAVLLVGRRDLPAFLHREEARGAQFDSKVLAYLAALS